MSAETYDAPTAPAMPYDEYEARIVTTSTKVKNIVSALEAYPFRLDCIKTLRIEPSAATGSPGSHTTGMMKLVERQVQRLDILPLPTGLATEIFVGSSTSSQKFPTSELTFPNLVQLRCVTNFSSSLSSLFREWLVSLESLQDLEYCYVDEIAGPSTFSADPHLPKLRRLTYSGLDDSEPELWCAQSTLDALLVSAPDLEFLRLKGTWRPNRKDLRALADLKHLKTIVIVHGDDAMDMGGVEELYEGGIEFQRFGKLDMQFEQAAVECMGWDETEELAFEVSIVLHQY
jgi:hypothetical protein